MKNLGFGFAILLIFLLVVLSAAAHSLQAP